MNSFSLKANRKYPSLPGVGQTAESHVALLELIAQAIATHERRDKDVMNSFVRIKELIDLGIAQRQGDKLVLTLPTSGGSSGAIALADLIDVDLTGLADGDALVYDSGAGLWVPAAVSDGGDANITPDTHPAVPDPADDEFEVGSSIDTSGTRFSGATAWAWRNQGSATAAVRQGSLVLSAPITAGDDFRIVEQAITGNFAVRAKLAAYLVGTNNSAGVLVLNSTSGKFISIYTAINAGNDRHFVSKYDNVTTWNADLYAVSDTSRFGGVMQWLYYEIEYDGTTVFFRVSPSGVEGSFRTLASETIATFLGTPDRVGLLAGTGGGGSNGPAKAVVDWFRRIA